MPKIEISILEEVVLNVLLKCGVSLDHCKIIADTIIYAHRTGKGTHGISRLPIYIKKIKNGSINPTNELSIIKNNKAIVALEGNNSFGQIVAYESMNMAIEKAKEFGVGIVSARGSNNFGTASYFLNQAAEKEFVSVIYSNSAPAIATWGGSKPIWGTNPIGYGFPTGNGEAPFLLDMATSFAARGKIRLAAKNNEKIPFGWALDANGQPTDDPHEALNGTLIPIGEHKGAGLSMVVDLLAGLLSGSAFGGNVLPLNTNGDFSRNGHFFMALNIDFFMNKEDYYDKIKCFISNSKENTLESQLLYPGENSYNNYKNNANSVEISDKVWTEISELLDSLEINII